MPAYGVVLEEVVGDRAAVRRALFKLLFLDGPTLERLLDDLPAHLKGGMAFEEAEDVAASLQAAGGRTTIRPAGSWMKLRMTFTSENPEIQEASHLVEGFLDEFARSAEDRAALIACFREAAGNAHLHGNQADPSRTVTARLIYDGEACHILVQDQGTGFDPAPWLARPVDDAAFELSAESRAKEGGIGGLGILIMRRCADHVRFGEKGNRIEITRKLRSTC